MGSKKMLITFSGLDGSGKTTVIRRVKNKLNSLGYNCRTYTVYFDVSLYGIIRKVIRLANNDSIQIQNVKLNNDEKSNQLKSLFRSKYTKTVVIYLDAIITWSYYIYFSFFKREVLIFDRYYYDFLVDLQLEGMISNNHLRILKIIYPKPFLSIYLDIDATEAWNRKHEYTIEYLHEKRGRYKNIFTNLTKKLEVYNDNLDNTLSKIYDAIR
jgi:thymidylate kinase